jgi:hypothetical protein
VATTRVLYTTTHRREGKWFTPVSHLIARNVSLGWAIIVSLWGCQSFSRSDCEGVNWFEKGQHDARRGLEYTEFEKYGSTCEGLFFEETGLNVNRETF